MASEFGKFTNGQLEQQLNTVIHFLSAVHPTLVHCEGFRPCVELRPILRMKEDPRDGSTYMLKRSLQLWDLEPKSIERLKAFLERHNGSPTCLFYSVFVYDNHTETITAEGKKRKTGKISSTSALYAQEIALDFDHIDFDGYTQLVDRFESMRIYAFWVFSGHGYQAHILLDQPMTDKHALRQAVYKFRSKGFDCDSACVDPARVMRLPGTHNLKCLVDDDYAYERENPPLCSIMQETEERYSLEDIFSKLDTLPTVSAEDELVYKSNLYPATSSGDISNSVSDDLSSAPDGEEEFRLKRIEYPYLSDYEFQTPIRKMLAETPRGFRNSALGFLIKHFKKQCKLGKDAIYEILSIWAKEACVPVYPEDEFKRDFSRLYYEYDGLGYDPKLAAKFGSIDFDEIIRLRKQDIHIPNKFFRSFATLDGKTVRLYLAIKMLEHLREEPTQDRLAEVLGLTTRALRPTLQDLIKSGHGYMVKGNARNKVPATYHTSHMVSNHDGFVRLSYNDVKAYVSELFIPGKRGNNELKLYLFMLYKFYSNEIFMSQKKLGENIGVLQTTISGLVNRLEESKYLQIRKVYRSGNMLQSCEYKLLR